MEVFNMKTNYHTHTYRCNHAKGLDEEYVLAAIKNGYDELGFADHSPWAYDSDFVSRIRMPMSAFKEYCDSVKALKEKYKDQINILLGVEAEYFSRYLDSFKDMIKEYELDYVILGNHYYETDELGIYYGRCTNEDKYVDAYVDSAIEGMKTGLYSYLAHPDVFMRGRKVFDDKAREACYRICEFAKANDVVLEFNLEGLHLSDLYGPTHYPNLEFWKIASEIGNKVIIGVDAHEPDSLATNHYRDYALKVINELNLELVDRIPRKF